MKIRYSTYVLVAISLLQVGCTPVGYDVNFDTKMAPEDSYFLDVQRKNRVNNTNVTNISTENVTPSQKQRRKKIEDMTFYNGSSSHPTYGKSRKLGKKLHYKIIAQDMRVDQFLYYIFQEILVNDFYVDPKIKTIKEKVTLKIDKDMTRSELMLLLKELLKSYNVKIEEKDNVLRAIYTKRFPREATGGNLITLQKVQNDISDDTIVSQYIELSYMDANDFISLASGIFFKDVTIKKLKDQNGFIINGAYGEIKKVLNFKQVVDHPFMTRKHTSLIYFDYILPSDFEKEFVKILKYQNIDDIKLLPLDTINALMVITSNKNNLRFLMKWKSKFDTYKKSNDSQETYFYYSKYRSIAEIYELLNQFNGGATFAKKDFKVSDKIADTNKKEFVETKKIDNKNINKTKSKNSLTQNDTISKNNIKIIPDESRNMLIVRATPAEYKKIFDVLNKIDTQPLQLLVEANIIEVTLQNDLQYGMEWFLRNRANDQPSTGSQINILGQTTLGLGNTGFFGIVSSGYFKTMLNLFAKKNLINVLSHPKILVLNGEEASIQVGEKIPTLSSTMSNVANPENAVSTVTYSDTGLTLNVKPSVTANGVIMMEISQTISKGQKNALSNISSPIILNRQIDTKLVLKDNQSVIMGGLIQHDVSVTDTKVPFFSSLPLVSNLFKTKSNSKTKTELILLIKVHIIDNFGLLDQIKRKFNRMLSIDNSCRATRCVEPKKITYTDMPNTNQPYEVIETIDVDNNYNYQNNSKKIKKHNTHSNSIEEIPLATTYEVEEVVKEQPLENNYTEIPLATTIPANDEEYIETLPLAETYPLNE